MLVRQKEDGQFWVTSADDPDEYAVDISKGMRCTCEDFHFRCEKKLANGAKLVPYGSPERTICKHCQAVLVFIGQFVVAKTSRRNREDLFTEHI